MTDCAARGCINHISRQAENPAPEDVTYYLFPIDELLRGKWINHMNQEDFEVLPNSALCSLHFIKEYFTTDESGKEVLRPDAIPTEFELDSMVNPMEAEDLEDDIIRCCAYKCANSYDPDVPITFHRFPTDNPELCDQWLLAMNVTQLAAKQAVLCSEHFDESCFFIGDNGQKLILADAVPSIFEFPETDPLQLETDQAQLIGNEMPAEPNSEPSEKYEISESGLEVLNRHDELVSALKDESDALIELAKQKVALEKEKRNLDYLIKCVLSGGPVDKARLRGLRPTIKIIDEIAQQIVVDCLAPCVALPQED